MLNGNGVYKLTTVFLAGVMVALIGAWATTYRVMVTRDEFPGLLAQYLPDRESLRAQNQVLIEKDAETSARLQALEIEFAKIIAEVDELQAESPVPRSQLKRAPR